MDLCTIDDARSHTRSDSAADDVWFEVWIPAISQAVLSWLKDDWRAYEPSLDAVSRTAIQVDPSCTQASAALAFVPSRQ